MKNDGKVYFVENSIYSLIIVIKQKRKRNFSILKLHEKWWRSKFCWKLYLFTNITYKIKKNSNFFNFENFTKFYSMKNDGIVIFVESSIYSLIIVIKLKRKQNFSILKFHEKWWKSHFFWKLYPFTNNSYKTKKNSNFFNFEILWKMMEKIFLLKTLSIY